MRPIDTKYFVQEHAMVKYFKMGNQWVGMGWEDTLEEPFVSKSKKCPSSW